MKVQKTTPFYLEVEPSENYWFAGKEHRATLHDANRLSAEIRRHCDVREVSVRGGKPYFECSHCGREWEEYDDGSPCCCNEAVREWEASKA